MLPTQMMSMFDNLFNDSLGKFERNVFFTPRVDVTESDKAFEVNVALPGLKKEDINIEVKNDLLTISGERKMKNENNDSKYHLVETYYGKFSRTFSLPENVAGEGVSAEFTDGILKIEVPKTEVKENKTTVTIK